MQELGWNISYVTYVCDCNQGFENKDEPDSECIDEDECNEFDCGLNNTCTNTIGSYKCACKPEFEVAGLCDQCMLAREPDPAGQCYNDNSSPRDLEKQHFTLNICS